MDWDFTELVQENNTQIRSNGLGMHKNAESFSVDLKLGRLGEFRDELVNKLEEPSGRSMVSSPSKRKKGINGTQNVLCLVDECRADLSKCREYHRRHRVCECHSKTPVVVVGGKEQRFCQQCSRFQSLGEFDGEKRSCRKRLDGHNRRRRKLQPEPFYTTSGSFFSNHQGPRLLQFSVPQSYTTSTIGVVSPLPSAAKQHQELYATDQRCKIPYSLACNYNGRDKQLPFLLASDPERSNQADPEVSICQQIVNNRGPAEMGSQKVLSGGLTQSINSKSALSLLSTHATQASVTSSSHLVPQGAIKPNQPIGLHFDLVQYSDSRGTEERPPILAPQARNSNYLCDEIFQAAPEDLLEKGASQVLPFSWN